MIDKETQAAKLLSKEDLFEGDIKISEAIICKYYNLSRIWGASSGGKESGKNQGITTYRHKVWPNALVPYQFESGVPKDLRLHIHDAMDHWEDKTCLRFTPRNQENEYVEYT